MSLRIEDLKVVYRTADGGSRTILDIPRFEVPPGEEACLAGSSGSGKTTLLNAIAGIVLPTSGRILVADTDLTTLSEARRDAFRAANIGYVFQTFNLLQGLTALENVRIAQSFAGHHGRASAERAMTLLDRVGLAGRRTALPKTLSVGEQQRVAIARAVVNRPRVVLADEPTANLDESNGDAVLELLREAAHEAGAILLLVTHERRVQDRFRRVVPLRELSR